MNGTLGETGTGTAVAGRMICAPILGAGEGAGAGAVVAGARAPAGAGAGVGAAVSGPNGCSSCCTRPTNSSASAFAIAAARSGDVSVTAAESTTVSGCTVTVMCRAS